MKQGPGGSIGDYINPVAISQVKELLTNHGPIGVRRFDNEGTGCDWRIESATGTLEMDVGQPQMF